MSIEGQDFQEHLKKINESADSDKDAVTKLNSIIQNIGRLTKNEDDTTASELYKSFEEDLIQIVQDGLLNTNDRARINDIHKALFMTENAMGNELLNALDENTDSHKSIKSLVYAREQLLEIEGTQDLHALLGMVESVGSGNISDEKLVEINILVKEIFKDKTLDKSDVDYLQKLSALLLLQYNVRSSRSFENFHLSENNNLNETTNVSADKLLEKLAQWDKKMDFNEQAPSLGKFFDTVALDVKRSMESGNPFDSNSLGGALQEIYESCLELWEIYESGDLKKLSSIPQILESVISLVGNLGNGLRHAIPQGLFVLFTGIKEFKNYYLSTIGEEHEQGIAVQEMHNIRDAAKDKWLVPDSVPQYIDEKFMEGMACFNGVSDGLLDYIPLMAATITPEVLWKHISESVEAGGIKNILKILGIENIDFSTEKDVLYFILYILTMSTLMILVPLKVAGLKIAEAASKLSKIVGKPVDVILSAIQPVSQKVSQGLKTANKVRGRVADGVGSLHSGGSGQTIGASMLTN